MKKAASFIIIVFIALWVFSAGNLKAQDQATPTIPQQITQPPTDTSAASCKVDDYPSYIQKYGFYQSTGNEPLVPSDEQTFLQIKEVANKWAPKVNVDPALATWWAYFETGGKKDSYSYSNCDGVPVTLKYSLDQACPIGSDPREKAWQLGYGQQFTTYSKMPEAFQAIYGNPSDPKKTQEVGQKVFRNAGQNKEFPEKSLTQLINEVKAGNQEARYLVSVLHRDPAISIYLVSTALVGFNRQAAFNYGPYYQQTWQKASNLMNTVVNKWNSTACTSTGSNSSSTTSSSGRTFKSKAVITKVGNPTEPAPNTTSTRVATSCPVKDFGAILTNSYEKNPQEGHCTPDYVASTRGICRARPDITCSQKDRRTAKAIDIQSKASTGGKPGPTMAVLPKIAGKDVEWKLLNNYDDSVGGRGLTFEYDPGGGKDKWYLDYIHIKSPAVSVGNTYPSGTELGEDSLLRDMPQGRHIHVTIGKNVRNPLSPGSNATDCDPGWLATDYICGGATADTPEVLVD
jgi:hypothetical protein